MSRLSARVAAGSIVTGYWRDGSVSHALSGLSARVGAAPAPSSALSTPRVRSGSFTFGSTWASHINGDGERAVTFPPADSRSSPADVRSAVNPFNRNGNRNAACAAAAVCATIRTS